MMCTLSFQSVTMDVYNTKLLFLISQYMLTLKGCKWGYLVFHRKRLEPRLLPWLHMCHSVSFVMYISGAKFEEHCSSISGDVLDSVFYCLNGTIYDVITLVICIIQKRKYLFNKNTYSKKPPHSSLLWKAFQISSNHFYFIGTLRVIVPIQPFWWLYALEVGGGFLCAPYDSSKSYSLKIVIKLMWSYVSNSTCLLSSMYDWKK